MPRKDVLLCPCDIGREKSICVKLVFNSHYCVALKAERIKKRVRNRERESN